MRLFSLCLLLVLANPALAGDSGADRSETIEHATLALNQDDEFGTRISTDPSLGATRVETGGGLSRVYIATIDPEAKLNHRRITFTADVKSEALNGQAYLEMWVHFYRRNQYAKGIVSTVRGDSDWKTLSTSLAMDKVQNPTNITLHLVVEGEGRVWIRNARLKSTPVEG